MVQPIPQLLTQEGNRSFLNVQLNTTTVQNGLLVYIRLVAQSVDVNKSVGNSEVCKEHLNLLNIKWFNMFTFWFELDRKIQVFNVFLPNTSFFQV